MSLLSIPKHETLDEKSQSLIDGYKARVGFDNNMFKALTHKPALLHAFADFIVAIKQNMTLDASLCELIMVYVSKRNECAYWGTAHTASGKQQGLSNKKLDSVNLFELNEELYTDKELAALEFISISLTAGANTDSSAETQNLLKYFSEAQVVEILFLVNYMLCTNTINNTLNIQMPDELKMMS